MALYATASLLVRLVKEKIDPDVTPLDFVNDPYGGRALLCRSWTGLFFGAYLQGGELRCPPYGYRLADAPRLW